MTDTSIIEELKQRIRVNSRSHFLKKDLAILDNTNL